jgi:hypothetical protein
MMDSPGPPHNGPCPAIARAAASLEIYPTSLLLIAIPRAREAQNVCPKEQLFLIGKLR